MIIISDCGGTKSDWTVVCNSGHVHHVQTGGINPIHQKEETIINNLEPVARLISQLYSFQDSLIVYFYGAGCNAVGTGIVRNILLRVFRQYSPSLHIYSDLLGAARSLCQQGEGIACILGTGSNSCLYDGNEIMANTPPLGYILGDEGSGADLGKHFLHDLLKGQLPIHLQEEFYDTFNIAYPQLIQRIYQQPQANRFMASIAPFIHSHLECQSVSDIVRTRFRSFVNYNIKPYQRPELAINFVGSVAYYFRDLLTQAIEQEGLKMGVVERTPMPGLMSYHKVVNPID